MEEPVLIPSGGGALHGMLYQPAGAPACGLLLCNPLFEERKGAQRPLVELARALAADGWAVLRFDYRGCGDSAGDFAAFGGADWRGDIVAASRFLAERAGVRRVGWLGLRLGATLVAEAAAATPDAASFLVLWEPVVNGRVYLDQELRRKLVREMATFGQGRSSRAALRRELAAGKAIDLDGYPLSPRLAADLEAMDLSACAGRLRPRVLLVQIARAGLATPEASRLRAALTAGGAAVDLVHAEEDPFWNLVGLVECPTLLAKTRAWVRGLGRCRVSPRD